MRRQLGRQHGVPLLALILLIIPALGARGQEPGAEIRGDALRVFLDCNTFPSSSDYFRTEVGFVNWVRDRTLAQVEVDLEFIEDQLFIFREGLSDEGILLGRFERPTDRTVLSWSQFRVWLDLRQRREQPFLTAEGAETS